MFFEGFIKLQSENDDTEKRDDISNGSDPSLNKSEEVKLSNVFKCPECPSSFSNKRNLKKHSVKHSSERHECSICGERIKHQKNFRRHLSLHADKITFYHCKFCGKDFNRKTNYKRHLEGVHGFIVT